MSISRGMDKEDVVHIYSGLLLSHKKEWNWVICRDVGGPRDCQTKWRKKEKHISYTNAYMWNLEKWYSVQFSPSVVSNSLTPHGPQHARLLCPSPTPRAYSNSCPLSRWCHPTISSSVIPFSCHLQSLLASRSFQMSQFFTSGGQSIGVSASASVLPMNIQDWFPLGWTSWISLLSKGFSRVFNSTVQNHQFFGAQFSLESNSYIHTQKMV